MAFPKWVYKRNTGKKTDESGQFTAESMLVKSQVELEALGNGWCDSPAEAAESKTPTKKEVEVIAKKDAETVAELEELMKAETEPRHHAKKVK